MKQILKIGILIDQLVPGGVQKSAIKEARNLKALGHQVTLFVLVRLDYGYQYQDLSQDLKVVFLSDFNPWPFRRALRIPYFAFLTHLHLLNPLFAHHYTILKKLDFIISHGTTTCITAKAISRKMKVPYLAFIWDPMIFIWRKVYRSRLPRFFFLIEPLIQRWERSFLITAALVATSSKVHQQFIKNIYYVNPLIIHPGCHPPRTSPKKTDQLILGYTRWELSKNPQLFLWLAQKLPQAKFLIAGAWTNRQEEAEFKKLIKKNHLAKRVKLQSPITEKDLKKIARQSLVWLHPNFEAFGMAGLEMAARGLPIIIPQGSGVTELFQEGQHGFFPPAKDKQAFLNHLKLLLDHPRKASQMGLAAAQIARRYTWKKHSRLVLKTIIKYHRRRKIVCLANAFVSTASTGGGDQFLIKLARRVPKNIHLTIILPSPGYYHYQDLGVKKDNVRYLVLPQNRFDNRDSPLPLFLAYLIRSFQTSFLLSYLPSFQVLHTATDFLPDSLPAYFFHRQSPEIFWASRFFHFIEPPLRREGHWWVNTGSYLLQQFCLKLLRHSDLVMIDNPGLRKKLMKKNLQSRQIELHPGGVDIKEIGKAQPKKTYASSAIFVGRLNPHKGIFDAVDVWQEVVKKQPTAKLIMIGYGPAEIVKELRKKIKKAGLQNNIHLTGYIISSKKLNSYRRSSKLLLFLDHEAGFGLVNAEAMAAGLPVIAYDLPIFGTTFKKGFLTAPLGDAKATAAHIVTLLTQPDKYEVLSHQAKQEAIKFDWSRVSRQFYYSLTHPLFPTSR